MEHKIKAILDHQHDIKGYLQETLLNRCRVNPQYSLRAFARALDLEPSALSKILRGKRKITVKMFGHLCKRLELNSEIIEKMSEINIGNSQCKKEENYKILAVDTFQVISDWYHYAILELIKTKYFKSDTKWVAKTLGITVSEVCIAIERLKRLGFLRIDSKGKWHDDSGNITTVGSAFTTNAFKKMQRQILEKAIVALEEVAIQDRSQSSITLAVDSRMLPKIEEQIKLFRRKLVASIELNGNYDQVYNFCTSFYPISKTTNK
jgi:transcriptional regulator with XRE-family HTH domain